MMSQSAWLPEVQIARRTLCRSTWRWHNPPGHRACLNVWFIAAGRGRWRDAQRTYELRAGDCFVQRLWLECWGDMHGERPLEVLWANFGMRRADGRALDPPASEHLLPPVHRHFDRLEPMRILLERMITRAADGDHGAASRWLACALDECARRDQAIAAERGHDVEPALLALCASIRADPARRWQVAEMAAALDLAPAAFTRRFRQVAGVSPRECIADARIAAAKGLLLMSSLPVGAIAEELGYVDIFHFSRRFKERTGMSPSAFRREASPSPLT